MAHTPSGAIPMLHAASLSLHHRAAVLHHLCMVHLTHTGMVHLAHAGVAHGSTLAGRSSPWCLGITAGACRQAYRKGGKSAGA
ncbi:hypothetical protein [Skermanella aerolata]|uniref:hypothetical protein n=1 Tax=Skermanella aerolata TaxID=393310 RepID=UPI0011BFABB2|nr:hypothetical protein [Skermanella aerolata]